MVGLKSWMGKGCAQEVSVPDYHDHFPKAWTENMQGNDKYSDFLKEYDAASYREK